MAVLPKPDSCRGCLGWHWPCPSAGKGWIPPSGTGDNGVLIVHEAGGADEVTAGQPMAGKAGFQFTTMLQRAGLRRDDFRVANVLFCRPPANELRGAPYANQVVHACAPNLDREIYVMKPRCILAAGVTAFERILPEVASLPGVGLEDSKRHKGARGYVFWSARYQTWVIPTIHPAHILRGKTNKESIYIHDCQKAVWIASEGFHYDEPIAYTLDPTAAELQQWLLDFNSWVEGHPTGRLSTDIETPTKGDDEDDVDLDDPTYQILRVGFAYQPGHGLSLPWQAHYLPAIKHLVEAHCDHLWWNGAYDIPRLRANGLPPGGTQVDGMVAWHLLHSDLPKSLNFVTTYCCPSQRMWKHEASRTPALYNVMDADVAGRNMVRIESELRKASLWPLYEHHVLRLNPIRAEMSAAGVPIDPKIRLVSALKLAKRLADVKRRMQEAVPQAAKRLSPAQGYVRPPADTTGMVEIDVAGFAVLCPGCGMADPKADHFKSRLDKTCAGCGKKWSAKHKCDGPALAERETNPCAGLKKVLKPTTVRRWANVEPFVPSLVQIQKYQQVMRHDPVWTGRGNDRKQTTDAKAIAILMGRHPNDRLYPAIDEYRELDKLAGQYIGRPEKIGPGPRDWRVVGGLPVDANNLCHTTLTDAPSTWRMSSVAPNLQNIPRGTDSEVQAWVKQMFVAPKGWLIGSRDFSGIEAKLSAYLMGSKLLYRLAALGIHDFYGLNLLVADGKLPPSARPDPAWSDADLKAAFGEYKAMCKADGRFPGHRDVSKRVIYLSLYKGTPMKMHQEYPKDFPTTKAAARLQRFLYDLFPEITKWHESLCQQVDDTTFIRMPFGYIHRFYRVLNWDWNGHKWDWSFGDDAKRLIASVPQNTASGILKEAAVRIGEGYPDVRAMLRLFIHDDITGLYRVEESDRFREVTKREMERPVLCLPLDPTWQMGDHVVVGTEFKEGTSWGNQHTVKE